MVRWIATFAILCLVAKAQSGKDWTQYVNPFIGTGQGAQDFGMGSAAGNTPPGAAYPFGMALWSPDTTTQSGGYRYEHNAINGFSLTHFSGRGISCWQDVPVMPVAGEAGDAQGAVTFSHDHESASPGYYRVDLDNGVRTELTVTQRTGFGRFTFGSDRGTILVNAAGSANGNWGTTWLKFAGDSQLYGAVTSGNCGGDFSYTVYFVMQFDRAPASVGATSNQSAYLTFDTSGNSVVQAKVGLSFVGFTNAYTNLSAENTGWNFDDVRNRASAAWNARLSTIQVTGREDRMRVFYTALYHASIHPSTFSDANGDYLGFDGKVHYTPRTQYHNLPTWDFYRSMAALLAITAPDVASDVAQSLVNDAQQDPGGAMPRWVHAAADSCGMIGDGGPKVVATMYAFGATDFDTEGALSAMVHSATEPGASASGCKVRDGLEDYLALGYVSTSLWGSASRTLEYAMTDFAISQFAAALGHPKTSKTYLKRAQNWKNLEHGGYIVPRGPDGQFIANYSADGCVSDAFVEGSGGQYSFMVRFNESGLFNQIGGKAAAIARLDRHFEQLNAGPCSEFAFMGNEISLKTPWMYAFAGAPWKTQQVVRRVLEGLYADAPGGMPGNDDGGVLSAWVVFAALGMYPQISGVGGLVVGSPEFPQAAIHLANGAVIRISAPDASETNFYVQGLKVNGPDYGSAWIPWSSIAGGGQIDFVLGAVPNTAWGTQQESAPPSYDDSGQ